MKQLCFPSGCSSVSTDPLIGKHGYPHQSSGKPDYLPCQQTKLCSPHSSGTVLMDKQSHRVRHTGRASELALRVPVPCFTSTRRRFPVLTALLISDRLALEEGHSQQGTHSEQQCVKPDYGRGPSPFFPSLLSLSPNALGFIFSPRLRDTNPTTRALTRGGQHGEAADLPHSAAGSQAGWAPGFPCSARARSPRWAPPQLPVGTGWIVLLSKAWGWSWPLGCSSSRFLSLRPNRSLCFNILRKCWQIPG